MSNAYDVVILGAGINGLAVARALALEGKSVCVVDKGLIACGASSHSSRLIHGGLRYLEHSEFSLVKEALKDQAYLLQNYPDLVKRHPFYLPHYKHSSRPAWMIKLGLFFYRFFAFHPEKSKKVDIDSFKKEFSVLNEENLEAVYSYYDAQTQDKKLTQTIGEEARKAGTIIKENQELTNLTFNEQGIRVKLPNETLSTKLLINATGAWIDEVNTKFRLPTRFSIEKLSGIHLVLEGRLTPEPLILETQNQRIIFILPQENNETLIGTTEHVELRPTDTIMVNEADVSYLLREINLYLKTPLQRDDIKSTFVGVRPIIKTRKNPSKMSREYKLDLHTKGDNRLLHIYGGKLTTFNSLSRNVSKLLKG